MVTLAMEVTARPIPALHASRELVLFATYLSMDASEMERFVAQVIDENPALIRTDPPGCPECGSKRPDHRCGPFEGHGYGSVRRSRDPDARRDGNDVFADPEVHATLADDLIRDARLLLDREARWLVEEVVGNLDDDGYLRVRADDLADSLGVASSDIRIVLDALRAVGGPAIGAANLQEALSLQLAPMESLDPLLPIARALVRDHLKDLEGGRLAAIARAIGATRDEIVAARDFIRRVLRPRPVAGLRLPVHAQTPRHAPEIIIRQRPDDGSRFEIDVEPGVWTDLGVDALYVAMAAGDVAGATPTDRAHADELVSRARAIVVRLRDRRDTLRRVAVHVIERQRDYVRFGPAFLTPLTRTEVASALGLHESTVSRAVAHRTVGLPDGRLVSFGAFFQHGAVIEDALRRLIETETRPMTDADLAAGLRDAGYQVARRTVTKYRRRLGVPPAADRPASEAIFA